MRPDRSGGALYFTIPIEIGLAETPGVNVIRYVLLWNPTCHRKAPDRW